MPRRKTKRGANRAGYGALGDANMGGGNVSASPNPSYQHAEAANAKANDLNEFFSDNRRSDSCTTFGYCFGYFAKSACRVSAAAGASAGLAYKMGVPAPYVGAAALIGAMSAIIARCGDDCANSCRTVDAQVEAEEGTSSVCRTIAQTCIPCVPEQKKTYNL